MLIGVATIRIKPFGIFCKMSLPFESQINSVNYVCGISQLLSGMSYQLMIMIGIPTEYWNIYSVIFVDDQVGKTLASN